MKLRQDRAIRGKWRIPDGKGGEWCVFIFKALKVVAPHPCRLRTASVGP
jgi:hypothetical protein